MPAARLRRDLGGHGRRRAVLRHLRAGAAAGRVAPAAPCRARAPAPTPAGPPARARRVRRPPRPPRPPSVQSVPSTSRSSSPPPGVPPLGLGAAVAGSPVRPPGRSVSVRSSRTDASGPTRGKLGAGLVSVPAMPRPDPAGGGAGEPGGARAQAVLQPRRVRGAGGPQPRRAAGPHRGLLHQVRPPVLLHAQAPHGRHRARPVRRGGLPGARRARLDLPGRGPGGLRPLGGAQGPAGHRRPGRAGRGGLRAALPRRDRAPQHRADLQLRRAPRPAHRHPRRLHRHGVRRRQVAQGDRQRAPHSGRQAGAAAGRRRPSRSPSRPWRPSATCTAATCSTATSRSTTRSRPRTASN